MSPGWDVTKWFNLMPNDWTPPLLAHLSVRLEKKRNRFFLPAAFSLISRRPRVSNGCLRSFPVCYVTRPLTGRSLEGVEGIPAARLQDAFLKTLTIQKHTDPNWWDTSFEIGLKIHCQSGSRHYATTGATNPHAPTLLMSSQHSVLCILELPEHRLLYAEESLSLFLDPTREGSPDPCPIGTRSPRTRKMWLAGSRRSSAAFQSETSRRTGRPEWPNCTLNLYPLHAQLYLCYIPSSTFF